MTSPSMPCGNDSSGIMTFTTTVPSMCRGLVTAISIGEGTGFRDGTEAALVVPSANKEKDLPRFRPPERKTLLLLV